MVYLKWSDLTPAEQEQAETSFLSLAEDLTHAGDEWYVGMYECVKNNRIARLKCLSSKTFLRNSNGYIFVNP